MPIVTTSSRKRPGRRPVLPIAIAAIAIVAIVAVYLGARAARPRKPQPPAVSDTTTQPAPSAAAGAAADRAERGEAPRIPDPAPPTNAVVAPPSTNNYVKKPGQMMLPNGRILTFPPPKEGETRRVASGGRVYECDHEGNWKDITPRRLFDTAFEANFLALSIEGRQFIPAFLVGLDQDNVVKVLKKDYVLKGDETEEEMAQIEAYNEMRGAALEYIAQGGTFDDFVGEVSAAVEAERKMRADGLKQVVALFKAGKREEALKRYETLNGILTEQGYKPIKIPRRMMENMGLADEVLRQTSTERNDQ